MSEAQFNKAVALIKALPEDGPVKIGQDQKLVFYKYYKQATEGDVSTERPGMFDFVGKAKWDAWAELKGKGISKEEAKKKYVEHFLEVLRKADNEEAKKLIAEVESA